MSLSFEIFINLPQLSQGIDVLFYLYVCISKNTHLNTTLLLHLNEKMTAQFTRKFTFN